MSIFIFIQFLNEYFELKNRTLGYLKTTNTTINKFLAENIKGYIYNYDLENIRMIIAPLDNPYIKNIYVTSADGEVLYSKINNSDTKKTYPIDKLLINSKNDDFLYYSAFEFLDVNMGYLIVEANKEQYNSELYNEIKEITFLSIITILLAVILSWIVSIKITKPIDLIIEKLTTTPKNRSIIFEPQKINEFNFLAQTVQIQRNKLIDLNLNLAQKISEEIEKSKSIEKKLFEAEKLAAMGEMIGNIAHQWRQPLSAISTVASGIKVKQEFEILNLDTLANDMDDIVEQTQYLSKTIDDFKNFVKNTNVRSTFSILDLVSKLTNITKSILKNHNINLITDYHDDYIIDGYENELIQALINIINNAKDALDNEYDGSSNDKYLFISSRIKNGKKQLLFYDNAGGIEDNIINKIFEPYFTTKHQSLGTGIGLSMAHNIISLKHQANFEVENYKFSYQNIQCRGAKFTITFR